MYFFLYCAHCFLTNISWYLLLEVAYKEAVINSCIEDIWKKYQVLRNKWLCLWCLTQFEFYYCFFYHLSPLAQHASVVREKCFAGCLLHDLQVHRPMPNFLQCRNKSVDNISLAFWKPVIFRLYKDLRLARIGYFCVSKRFRLKINVQPLSRITYCSVKEEE